MAKKLSEYKKKIRAKVSSGVDVKSAVDEVVKAPKTLKDDVTYLSRAARQIVIFSETPEQKERIREAAKSASVSMSAFIIQCVMESLEAK